MQIYYSYADYENYILTVRSFFDLLGEIKTVS